MLKKQWMPLSNEPISVGARQSKLSQAQAAEVLAALQKFHPHATFHIYFVLTQGDKDLQTSLRTLEKTNFFTKEIDELVLNGICRIGIHSAKDLPEKLEKGLSVIAYTKGLDPSDSLVLRPTDTLETLLPGSIIATSSLRREEAVKQMRKDLCFKDIRGTIEERLVQLEKGEADGVVVAEAALIRLGLTHLNRIKIPGDTVPFQGQLAIVANANDEEMRTLFSCILLEKRRSII